MNETELDLQLDVTKYEKHGENAKEANGPPGPDRQDPASAKNGLAGLDLTGQDYLWSIYPPAARGDGKGADRPPVSCQSRAPGTVSGADRGEEWQGPSADTAGETAPAAGC